VKCGHVESLSVKLFRVIDHTSLKWARLIVSKTAQLSDLYCSIIVKHVFSTFHAPSGIIDLLFKESKTVLCCRITVFMYVLVVGVFYCRWLGLRCPDWHASALWTWAWSGDSSQPGTDEHGTESNGRLRKITVSHSAKSVSTGNVSKPSAALCKIWGQCRVVMEEKVLCRFLMRRHEIAIENVFC